MPVGLSCTMHRMSTKFCIGPHIMQRQTLHSTACLLQLLTCATGGTNSICKHVAGWDSDVGDTNTSPYRPGAPGAITHVGFAAEASAGTVICHPPEPHKGALTGQSGTNPLTTPATFMLSALVLAMSWEILRLSPKASAPFSRNIGIADASCKATLVADLPPRSHLSHQKVFGRNTSRT